MEEILLWKVDSFIYHADSTNIFHPKIYLFEGNDEVLLIVGSNNLTEFGLVKNIEASVAISYNTSDSPDITIVEQVKEYFRDLISNNDPNLFPLNSDLIEKLDMDNYLPSEENRRKDFDEKVSREASDAKASNNINIFQKVELQKNPEGFSPKRKQRNNKQNSTSTAKYETIGTSDTSNSDDKLVLIAEIGGGARWKQISFTKRNFEDFFEVPIEAGINHYLNLKYISESGQIESTPERVKAIVKQSSNYNLEPKKVTETTITYNANSKPIILFIKLDSTNYIYHFQTPGNQIYNEFRTFLSDALGIIKRKETTLTEILEACPSFPQISI